METFEQLTAWDTEKVVRACLRIIHMYNLLIIDSIDAGLSAAELHARVQRELPQLPSVPPRITERVVVLPCLD